MKRILIYGGVVLAALILAAVIIGGKNKGAVTGLGAPERVLTAAAPLEPGKFIPSASIAWTAPASGEKIQDGALTNSSADTEFIQSAVPRRPISKGDVLTRRDLANPEDADFLPSVLKPGMRAISISVDDVTGGAGLFRPGNLVDVILTTSRSRTSAQDRTPQISKTLLRGVRVLAVNKDVGFGTKDEGRKTSPRAKDGTVTLEVSPADVEAVTLSSSLGKLSLSLCSSAESAVSTSEPAGETRVADIVGGDGENASPATVRALYGAAQSRQSAQ